MSNVEQLLGRCLIVGLVEVEEGNADEPITIRHPDGDRITFDTGEEVLENYLEGLLKAWDLCRCGLVGADDSAEEDTLSWDEVRQPTGALVWETLVNRMDVWRFRYNLETQILLFEEVDFNGVWEITEYIERIAPSQIDAEIFKIERTLDWTPVNNKVAAASSAQVSKKRSGA